LSGLPSFIVALRRARRIARLLGAAYGHAGCYQRNLGACYRRWHAAVSSGFPPVAADWINTTFGCVIPLTSRH